MIIDPRTGRPTSSKEEKKTPEEPVISPEHLVQVLSAHAHKIDALNGMHMQLAFWVEYITEKLMVLTGPDGEPLFQFDNEEFAKFAEKRWQQLQEQAATQNQAAKKEQVQELLDNIQEVYSGDEPAAVNLDE